MRLSIFWRLTLGSLAIIAVLAGVGLYALDKLRLLSASSTELASYHYPSLETAKRLVTSVYGQLRSEKKYLAIGDVRFLVAFEQEAEEFRQALLALQAAERSPEGQTFLARARASHNNYQDLVHASLNQRMSARAVAAYDTQRETAINGMTEPLQAYVALHEGRITALAADSRRRAAEAETVTEHLLVAALLLGIGLAALGTYSIHRPMRKLQEHMRAIGQGNFGQSLNVSVPNDMRELVDTVNWMGKQIHELDQMKADFVAHLTHDLRTPLTSVRLGSQLLLEGISGPLTDAQRETIEIIHDSSQRLITCVSTLLDLSKAEAGMMDYRIAPTDLKSIVESSIKKLRMLAEIKQIRVHLDTPHDHLYAPIDGGRMEQVFDNLLSNALKFTPKQGSVRIRMASDAAAGGVRISFSDTGPGIPSEDLPHIFQRFYQGQKRSSAGTGLGLALAKTVVEAHGGRIWARSDSEKGTTFEFILPVGLREVGAA